VIAPRAPEDSVRPQRLIGASGRPLNFTVRRRFGCSSLYAAVTPALAHGFRHGGSGGGKRSGHWYANVLTFKRAPYVLALSERSLLSVVLPGAPFHTLPARFPAALAQLLHALDVPESQVTTEVAATSPVVIASTANRRVLGCLNQFAFELSMHFSDEPHTGLLERELWLSENISSTIRYRVPREVALELLATQRSH